MPGKQRRRPDITAAKRARIRARIAAGMGVEEVAESIGISASWCRRIVREMGGKEEICREENGPVPARDRPRSHYCIDLLHRMRRGQKRRAAQ